MEALYPEWIKLKAADTFPANGTKLQWVWNTYYADSEIVKMDIASIDVIIMKEWFLKVIEKYKLSRKKYKKTHNVACLAICLNFSLALRVGELVALKTEDFSDSTVKIDRQEVKVYYIDMTLQLYK